MTRSDGSLSIGFGFGVTGDHDLESVPDDMPEQVIPIPFSSTRWLRCFDGGEQGTEWPRLNSSTKREATAAFVAY